MQKARIGLIQLFFLMALFQSGSAVIVGVGINARQDAWIAILLGMAAGMLLFLIYAYLFSQYPELPLSKYAEKILGSFLGKFVGFLYALYFCYIGARVLRDFADLVIIELIPETPMFVISLLMILVVIYGCYAGFEVIARSSEIFFPIVFVIALAFAIFVLVGDLPDVKHLQPVLEDGWTNVFSVVFPLLITFPFGELIAFTALLPYVSQYKNNIVIKVGLGAILFTGLFLSLLMSLIIAVMTPEITQYSAFPLLDVVEKINIRDFIQRIDPVAVVILHVGGFFKIVIFAYAAIVSLSTVFNTEEKKGWVTYTVAGMIYIPSLIIADNTIEHFQVGLEWVPYYLHIPFQIIIPLLLAVIVVMKNFFSRKKSNQSASS
ncbi:endospore germination permease [Thalassorhabdus alkalitolerans]|uniref:Endospore germination permease n=1 Tax=Thalassorhabdus alkalitolerans TaxID=2282697 RepID=A0ABW0YP28_9BACI